MKKKLTDRSFILLDGAMGTVLQQMGVAAGRYPEMLNLTHPEIIEKIHASYVEAGSDIIYTNTFGANRLKLDGCGHSVEEIVEAAIKNARRAAGDRALVALDIGPIGTLVEPLGDLTFEEAYDVFSEMVRAGQNADLIVIETMSDLYETKAALLAAKENSSLPVMVTMSFEENGRTYTGCTAESMARTLTALGADAIGVNCSLGPDGLSDIVSLIARSTVLPVIAKPNAGLPDPVTGRFDLMPEDFAEAMKKCIAAGATIVGGCCGTSPLYVAALKKVVNEASLAARVYEDVSFVCTPTKPVCIDGVRIVGERINPTTKPDIQKALLSGDLDYILSIGIAQEREGADLIDVNVGYPGVDEGKVLPALVKKLQSAVTIPLQLDSSSPEALAAALRVYNGKPSVNSVNGSESSLKTVLPLASKYGAAVVGLTLDKGGIPQTAEGRLDIAEKIVSAAEKYGVSKSDIWIDTLALTVSAQQSQARVTLNALRLVKDRLGVKTTLGVSNISYGMPNRELITHAFLAEALGTGLDLPIINPGNAVLRSLLDAHRVLSGEDEGSIRYIDKYANFMNSPAASSPKMTLEDAILRGSTAQAKDIAERLLRTEAPLSIVENRLIPTLDKVGAEYEIGTMFLPQLLAAAQASQAVFEVIAEEMRGSGASPIRKGTVILATVQGDIHDIGKNIVKTVLENYGYQVIDMGKDVSPEAICNTAEEQSVRLVGLSALMTTTLPAMEKTVAMLKSLPNPPCIMVGGAVVTQSYADSIGADFYVKDAKQSAEVAKRVFG